MTSKTRKGYFKRMLLLFFAGFAIVITASLILYFSNVIVKDRHEYQNGQYSRAKLLVQTIDDKFALFENVSHLLIESSWVRQISSSSGIILSDIDFFRQKEIREIMNAYNSIAAVTDSTALFLPGKSQVIDKVSIWEPESRYLNTVGINDDEFLEQMYSACDAGDDLFTLIGLPDGRFIVAGTLKAYQNDKQIVAFLVNDIRFSKFITDNCSFSYTNFSIINGKNSKIAFSGNCNEWEILNYVFPSSIYNWSYSIDVYNDYAISSSQKVTFCILLFLGLFTSLLLAYLLASMNYKPVANMIQTLDMEVKEEEFDEIISEFSQLRSERQSLQQISKQYYEVARNNVLYLLLHGAFNGTITDDILEMFNLPFANDASFVFTVAVIPFESSAFSHVAAIDSIQLQRYLQEKGATSVVLNTPENSLVALFCFDERQNEERTAELLNRYATDLRKYIKTFFNTECYLGFPHHGLMGISKSYQESMEARMDVETGSENSFFYPLDWEIQLIQQLKFGNKEAVNKIMLELKKENMSRFLSETQHRHVIDLVRKTLYRVEQDQIDNLQFSKTSITEFSYDMDNSNQWDALQELALSLCRAINGDEMIQNEEGLGYSIQKYVDDNFRDSNLSQKLLTDYYHMSSPSISKAFKNCVGVNFSTYLQKLRTGAAKKEFDNGNRDIHAVGLACGYSNDVTFRKAFYQIYAITPHQYIVQLDTLDQKQ